MYLLPSGTTGSLKKRPAGAVPMFGGSDGKGLFDNEEAEEPAKGESAPQRVSPPLWRCTVHMHVCACTCVCMYICVHVHVHVCACTGVWVYMYIYVCVISWLHA